MNARFNKAELLGATRQILFEIASWSCNLYDADASRRLIGESRSASGESSVDWEAAGSAGDVVERSIVLKHVGRVIDCLNTNTWHGASHALHSTYAALTPIQGLLESSSALIGRTDEAINHRAASSVVAVLDAFFARVKLEVDQAELELKELAAIAGLAEKTVRMAAIGQDRNPDLVTFKSRSRTYVTVDEARRWLATKNIDYSPINWSGGQVLPPVAPEDIDELAPYLRELREKASLSLEDLASRLEWGETLSVAYGAIESGKEIPDLSVLSLEILVRLSEVLCPENCRELVHIIDGVIHPKLLKRRLDQMIGEQGSN